MTRRAAAARACACALAASVALAHAGEPAGADALTAYLTAFELTYVVSPAEGDAVAAAQAAVHAAAADASPRLSLREGLRVGANGLELDLGVRLRMPLHDATAAPRLAMADADLALQRLYAQEARAAALAAFLSDLAALAVLAPAADLARATGAAADAAVLATPDPLALPPDEREAYEAATRARETATWLARTLADLHARVEGRLGGLWPGPETGAPRTAPAPPAPADLEAALAAAYALARGAAKAPHRAGTRPPVGPDAPAPGAGAPPAPPRAVRAEDDAVALCLTGSGAARIARARHAHALRVAAVDAAPDLRVTLTGGLDHSVSWGGAAGGGGPTGSIGVEARFVLPSGWPLAGSVGAEVGWDGLSQDLQVSWPPPFGAAPSVRPDEQLADELLLVAQDARALLRALASAGAERSRQARLLAWALLDATPDLPPAAAERLSRSPWDPGWPLIEGSDALRLAELRLDAALAHLGELSAAIAVAAHCGLLPTAGPG